MGQKHSAKYSLKKSGSSNKQQTAKIEDEIAFNTDSPGRASDDPIGVNLSSSQNDYIRNAANNMAKIWTETAVIESNGRNEQENDGKEKKSSNNEEGVAANMPKVDKSSEPDNPINKMQEKPADEEPMPNNEGDVIQNIFVPEISQEEQQKVTPIAEKQTIHQTEYAEEQNIVPDEQQIITNTTAEECDESIQQFVGKNDIQLKEIEAKMDLYEENEPNEVKEIGNNELEKAKTEVIEMPNEINKNSMEMPDEQNEATQQNEEEVANYLMLENAENQNPILEGIADYVANQQNVQSDGNEPEEINTLETESDGKDNFVSKNEDEKHHAEMTEGFETSNNSSMPMANVDPIIDDPKISTGIDNELKEVNQNEHQNECQKLANDIDNGEPNSTGKPSEL